MEQTCGRNPGTQLSRGGNTRLRWTRLKGEQQELGTLRPQANVLGISEKVGAPEVSVRGLSACGYIPTFTNPIPIYGKLESTALWSEVANQRLRVLRSLTGKTVAGRWSSLTMVAVIHLEEEIFDKTTTEENWGSHCL